MSIINDLSKISSGRYHRTTRARMACKTRKQPAQKVLFFGVLPRCQQSIQIDHQKTKS